MSWIHEMAGWLSDKLVYDEGGELDRMSLQLRGASADSRLSATRQLTYMRAADSVPLLIAALRDESASVRAAAATAIGYKSSRDAITPVAVLLDDPDIDARIAAVRALDEIGLPRSRSWVQFWRDRIVEAEAEDPRVAGLLGRALSDPVTAVRAAALGVLPRHGARGVDLVRQHVEGGASLDPAEHRAAEAELVCALEAREPHHRKAAVQALHKLYGEQVIRALAEALRDPSAEVRQAAVEAVTDLGPRPALGDLLDRLDDSDEGVVVRVVEGLVCALNLRTFEPAEADRIHEELLRLARRRDGRARVAAAWALGEMGRVAAVGPLCELLDEDNAAVATAACEALGKINDPRSVTHLMALVERSGEPTAVVAAARSLARAQDVRAVPVLVKALFAETRAPVAEALEQALAAVRGPAPEALRAGLGASDPATRITAVRRAISEPRLVLELIGQVLGAPDPAVREAALDVLAAQGYDVAGLARSALALADQSESRRILAINLVVALQPLEAVPYLDRLLADPDEPVGVYRHAAAALARLHTDAAKTALEARVDDPREPVREAVRAALGRQ